MKTPDTINGKTPEEIKKGLKLISSESPEEFIKYAFGSEYECEEDIAKDAIAYIHHLESSRWELFDDLSTAYYGKQMYGLNDDGTVYSRYSCDTMPFERAVDEFRRLISDE